MNAIAPAGNARFGRSWESAVPQSDIISWYCYRRRHAGKGAVGETFAGKCRSLGGLCAGFDFLPALGALAGV
jgi:hypothetical protein